MLSFVCNLESETTSNGNPERQQTLVARQGIRIVPVSDEKMPGAEALARTEERQINIRCSVYRGFESRNPRDVFTFIHEVGHFLLSHKGIAARSDNIREMYRNAATKLQEEEANYFTSVFLMPSEKVNKDMAPDEIMKACGVSRSAAIRRLEELNREHRRRTGEIRQFSSPNILNFFKEKEKRGMELKTILPRDDN
nr:ImmA/IrrE family metallo-endopeptidase [Hoeflea sp.]